MEEKLYKIYSKINRKDLNQVISKLFKPIVSYYDKRCDSEIEYDYIQDTVENMLMNLTRYERVNFKKFLDRNYINMVKGYKPLSYEELDYRILIQDFESGDYLINTKLNSLIKEIYNSNIKCINKRKYNIMVYIAMILATTGKEILTSRVFSVPAEEIYLNFIRYVIYSKIRKLRSEVNI